MAKEREGWIVLFSVPKSTPKAFLKSVGKSILILTQR